jgi:hypothetical protein
MPHGAQDMRTQPQSEQISIMLQTLSQALAACDARDFELVIRLAEQQEAELAAFMSTPVNDLAKLAPAERQQLEQVIAQRQLVQQRISEWIAQMREEMQTVSQNSRLLKTYTS